MDNLFDRGVMSRMFFTRGVQEQRNILALRLMNKYSVPTLACETVMKGIATPQGKCKCTGQVVCSLCEYACCEQAVSEWCVCTQRTSCSIHGVLCNGTHD